MTWFFEYIERDPGLGIWFNMTDILLNYPPQSDEAKIAKITDSYFEKDITEYISPEIKTVMDIFGITKKETIFALVVLGDFMLGEADAPTAV